MIAKQKIHGFTAAFDYNHKKMELNSPKDRAVLLDHNFFQYYRPGIMKEMGFLQQLRPNLKRNAYHVSLNFAQTDKLSEQQLSAIGREYLDGMGFKDNPYAIWQHFDADHLHIHVLASRINYDGSVVSDSNNYQRSESLCRKLEQKYGLEAVKSSKEAQDRAPSKDELEMIQRTGKLSDRMLMQERLKVALSEAKSIRDFIERCENQNIHILFNQSESTGRVSGITFISQDGFIAKGQKLGNQFKWSHVNQKIKYEQSRDSQAISETNDRTRARFKDLLDPSARENRTNDRSYSRHAGNYYQQSASAISEVGSPRYSGSEDESDANYGRAYGDEEAEQGAEKAISNQFSIGASAIISGIGGLLGSVGAGQVNDAEDRKRKKRKR